MNPWVFQLLDGKAFFVGLAILASAVGLAATPWRRARRCMMVVVAVAVLCITISATPLPVWEYVALATIAGLWRVVEQRRLRGSRGMVWWARGAVLAMLLGVAAGELSFRELPQLPPAGHDRLLVIGDSLSAGIGARGEKTWPLWLAHAHGLRLVNAAQAGASVAAAYRQVDTLRGLDGVVVIEIGGNDLLGTISVTDFARDLEGLLTRVERPGRTLVMFELPLLPLGNGFGLAQRRLARLHHVTLIPKAYLTDVLSRPGATIDGLHFTPAGHQRMAELVWRVIALAVAGRPTSAQPSEPGILGEPRAITSSD